MRNSVGNDIEIDVGYGKSFEPHECVYPFLHHALEAQFHVRSFESCDVSLVTHGDTIVNLPSTGSVVIGHELGDEFSVFVKSSMSIRAPFQGFGPDLCVAASVQEALKSAPVHITYLFKSGNHTRRRVPCGSLQTGGSRCAIDRTIEDAYIISFETSVFGHFRLRRVLVGMRAC